MLISTDIFRHEDVGHQSIRVCSKQFVQQGRSQFYTRNVRLVREHGKLARTPLAAFFNSP